MRAGRHATSLAASGPSNEVRESTGCHCGGDGDPEPRLTCPRVPVESGNLPVPRPLPSRAGTLADSALVGKDFNGGTKNRMKRGRGTIGKSKTDMLKYIRRKEIYFGMFPVVVYNAISPDMLTTFFTEFDRNSNQKDII